MSFKLARLGFFFLFEFVFFMLGFYWFFLFFFNFILQDFG